MYFQSLAKRHMSLESTVQRLENSILAEANDARHAKSRAQVAALQNARTRRSRELPRQPAKQHFDNY